MTGQMHRTELEPALHAQVISSASCDVIDLISLHVKPSRGATSSARQCKRILVHHINLNSNWSQNPLRQNSNPPLKANQDLTDAERNA
jgi:hypothetical protein